MSNLLVVDPEHPDPSAIRRAAEIIAAGGLVAFPTETVYGLGASALDAIAVNRIYQAKGRPSFNPLIVHVESPEAARLLTTEWTESAALLANHFWPGPLTLVLRRSDLVPANVSASLPTVALRSPAHPVARALLRACALPIAAPSANRSNEISPTRAEHVLASLGDRVDLILDGGAATVGIESTVLDLTGDEPVILRPGSIDRDTLSRLLGRPVAMHADSVQGPRSSPGMLSKHYAPRAEVRIFDSVSELRELLQTEKFAAKRIGVLSLGPCDSSRATVIELPGDPHVYAAALYDSLHRLDAVSELILIQNVPEGTEWDGVRDRIVRAGSS